jgi:hypothetical protein
MVTHCSMPPIVMNEASSMRWADLCAWTDPATTSRATKDVAMPGTRLMMEAPRGITPAWRKGYSGRSGRKSGSKSTAARSSLALAFDTRRASKARGHAAHAATIGRRRHTARANGHTRSVSLNNTARWGVEAL